VKIHRIDFGLAKIFYREFHRTNKPPVGHKKSYLALLGEDWHKCIVLNPDNPYETFWSNTALPKDWLEDLHDDVRIRSDDAGDLCVYTKGQIIGVCSIGRPVARWKDPGVYEITRICFNFWPQSNKEKKYFSKFIRVAIDDFKRVEPASKFVTYIHDHQSGRYLEYAGFKKDKHIKYSENNKGWGSRQNRSSSDLSPKYRFIREVA
tara:strand:- start:105 stop:722 length:618 start_codon:yes stop_codon:yes gene_type:complete